MKTTMHQHDHIDRALLQAAQDAFAEFAGTAVAFATPWGTPVTAPHDLHLTGEQPQISGGHPPLPPATVMLYSAETCLGQWIIGNAPTRTAPPDVRTLVFMPLGTEREPALFLGFDRQTIRDWQPEALELFRELARIPAERLDGPAPTETLDEPPRFGPVYAAVAHPGIPA